MKERSPQDFKRHAGIERVVEELEVDLRVREQVAERSCMRSDMYLGDM